MSVPPQLQQFKAKLLYFINKFTIKKNMQVTITANKYALMGSWFIPNFNGVPGYENTFVGISTGSNAICNITTNFNNVISYIILNIQIQAYNVNFAVVKVTINGIAIQNNITIPYVTGSANAIPVLQIFSGTIIPTHKLDIQISLVSGNIMIGNTVITYLPL